MSSNSSPNLPDYVQNGVKRIEPGGENTGSFEQQKLSISGVILVINALHKKLTD